MHWLQLNHAASESMALFGIGQYKIDFHLLASEYQIQTPFAGHAPCPMKGT